MVVYVAFYSQHYPLDYCYDQHYNRILAQKNCQIYNETGMSRELSHFRYWSIYICLINYPKSIYMYIHMCIYILIYFYSPSKTVPIAIITTNLLRSTESVTCHEI